MDNIYHLNHDDGVGICAGQAQHREEVTEDMFKVTIKSKVVTLELPKETRYIQDIGYAEIGIAADILKVNEKATEVKIVVTFDRPEPPQDTSEAKS